MLDRLNISRLQLRGDAEWLYVDADVKGPYSGGATLQCKPAYDEVQKKFTLLDLQISLSEASFLGKIAGKMLNNVFGDTLDTKIEEIINTRFKDLLEVVFSQMHNMALPKGGLLGFVTEEWNLSGLTTDARGFHFVAELKGKATMVY